MTPDEIEDLAFRGAKMPRGLDAAEQMLFQSFRRLYAYAKLVCMPAEQGKLEKAEILQAFRLCKFQVERMACADRMWNQIDAAAIKFQNERTLEHADEFIAAVYGACASDKKGVQKDGGDGKPKSTNKDEQ